MTTLHAGDYIDGRYRIATVLARGGMSTVYAAVDTRLDREVAVKIMDPQYANDPVFRARFEREARAVATLSHPSLVNVFDQGTEAIEGGRHGAGEPHGQPIAFLVMELVRGGSLRELLREHGPFDIATAVAIMEPVLTALSVAHAQGMIHRDIKPDNILIGADHQVKLADFGLVRAIDHASDTAAGQVIGTAAYLSPEQVKGERLTPAADVYSAGVVMYELLAGRPPFQAAHPADLAHMHLTHKVPAPSATIHGIPEEFDDVIATACHRDPEQRYIDAQEFLDDLREVAAQYSLAPVIVPIPESSKVQRALEQADFGERRAWDDATMATAVVDLHNAPTSVLGADDPTAVVQPSAPHVAPETAVLPTPGSSAPTSAPEAPAAQISAEAPLQETAVVPAQPQPPTHPTAQLPSQAPFQPASHPPAQPAEFPVQSPPAYQSSAGAASAPTANHPPVTNRSRMASVLWTVFVLLALVATAIGAWWVTSGRYGEIPTVVGMDYANASATVERAGFTPVRSAQYSDEVPAEVAIGTDPPFGQRALHGSQVAVLMSLGKPSVPDPGFAADATSYRALLAERNLAMSTTEDEYDAAVPAGMVLRVDPSPGTIVDTGSTVRVTLSKGPAPVEIPDLRGMTEDEALAALIAAGLELGAVTEDQEALIDAGLITSSSPRAGETVAPGTAVDVVVSTATRVPLVFGLTGTAAQQRLEDAGFQVQIDGNASGLVYSQSPAPLVRLPRGGTVVIKTL